MTFSNSSDPDQRVPGSALFEMLLQILLRTQR